MNERIEPLSDRAGDLLSTLVARARTHDVEYDTEAGLARHLARVEALPLVPWWQRALGGWHGGVALVVVAAAAAAIVGARREPATEVRVALAGITVGREAALPAAKAPVRSAPAAALVVAPSEPAALVPDVRPSAGTQRQMPSRVARSGDDDALAREAAQIRRARQRLEAGDAKGALAICKAGAREFPTGTFVPERAGIRVLALHALGRPDAAAARDYLARWPDGPLAPRVRATLGE